MDIEFMVSDSLEVCGPQSSKVPLSDLAGRP